MANNNSGGPWGGGGGNRGNGGRGPWGGGPQGGGRGPNGGGGGGGPNKPVPDIDEIVRRGQEQLKVLMGGRGGSGGGGGGPMIGRAGIFLGLIAAVVVWLFMSFYRVDSSEQSVELFLGAFSEVGEEGLNFAPWPLVTKEILPTQVENQVTIGNASRADGLMLTGDENIVDIEFQVVWNISNPAEFLFNLADPQETITAVSESAMREVIGRSELDPILNRDRGAVSAEVEELIQGTLDSYASGIRIIRLNLDQVDPPQEVIDAFRDVQAAEQERDTFESQADRDANRRLASARGEAAQLREEAEAYRARVVNEAQGEAARFVSVYDEYAKASEVTRKRLYLETIERVLADVDKVIIDEGASGSGQGVVPYLPLNELRRTPAAQSTATGEPTQ